MQYIVKKKIVENFQIMGHINSGNNKHYLTCMGPGAFLISSAENQKGINAVQQCSMGNQKGVITKDFVQQ